MRKNKITQIQTIFYRLYKHLKSDKATEFVPIFDFIGEIYIDELKAWGFMSYELPARFADIMRENPDMLKRIQVTGKTGAKYYAYRFADEMNVSKINDPELLAFYNRLKHANTA